MGAIGFLYRKVLINRVKKALGKPVTYVYLVFIMVYCVMVPYSLKMVAEEFGGDSPQGMAALLTLLAFWLIPGNLIAYAKRRGLVYRNSDVHFLFPAPLSPKQILIYAYLRTLFVQVLLNLFAVIWGGIMFRVDIWRLALYFLFAVLIENALEAGVMLLLYGSERLQEKSRRWIVKGAYGLTGVLVCMGIYSYLQEGLSLQMAMNFLNSDMVQMVPVAGWYIAVVHLLLTGPTVVSVVGTVCYGVLFAGVLVCAWRMKCTGAFYEDAIKFAEDYEEVLNSRRQGDTQKRLGKKQKFGKAHVTWKGDGAKALFYRQLLEYKKSRYFIFDVNTLVAAIGGVGIAYLYLQGGGFSEMEPFVIPVVSAYIIFIFTAMGGKWAKELLSPYTYMIPDSPFRKLVNATAMQLVQSVVNGILITVPGAIVMGQSVWMILLDIVVYVALYANKLYALAVAEIVTGSTLGKVGKQMMQMFLQGTTIFMAVMGALAGMAFGGELLACLFMVLFLILVTLIFMLIAMFNFYKMETA